jgi:hypothetical protein
MNVLFAAVHESRSWHVAAERVWAGMSGAGES